MNDRDFIPALLVLCKMAIAKTFYRRELLYSRHTVCSRSLSMVDHNRA